MERDDEDSSAARTQLAALFGLEASAAWPAICAAAERALPSRTTAAGIPAALQTSAEIGQHLAAQMGALYFEWVGGERPCLTVVMPYESRQATRAAGDRAFSALCKDLMPIGVIAILRWSEWMPGLPTAAEMRGAASRWRLLFKDGLARVCHVVVGNLDGHVAWGPICDCWKAKSPGMGLLCSDCPPPNGCVIAHHRAAQ